jgi:predicted phosphodiesterase
MMMRKQIKRDKSFNARYLICSDLQVPFQFDEAIVNLKKLVNTFKFDLVLNVGDELDLNTISKYSQGKAESYQQTLNADRDLCKDILYDLKTDVVSRSNHGDRLFSAVSQIPGLMALPELQYEKFMGYEDLGIYFAKKPYEIPGTEFVLCHGDEGNLSRVGGSSALNIAKRWGRSVIAGHSHRMGYTCHSEAFNGRLQRVLVGIEVGHTCNISKMRYLAKGGYYANWQAGAVIMTIKRGNPSFEMIRFNTDGSFAALGKAFG